MPKEVTLLGFANNLAVVVGAGHPVDTKLHRNETIHVIKSKLRMVRRPAERKPEAIITTNRRKSNICNIRNEDHEVDSKSNIKYLKAMISAMLSCKG